MTAFRHRSIIAFSCLVVLTFLAGCAGFTMFDTVESLMRLEYVRHDPSNLSAFLNLGKAYWQAGERLESLNVFRRVLELNPGNSEALQFLRGFGR